MAHFHLPLVEEETRPYWDAARDRRLLIQHCEPCDLPYFYTRPFCPRCWSDRVRWVEASGRAVLYTYSVVHWNDLPPFAARVPYVAAVVDLAEGPRMMTNLVGCEPADLVIGMPLEHDRHRPVGIRLDGRGSTAVVAQVREHGARRPGERHLDRLGGARPFREELGGADDHVRSRALQDGPGLRRG